jgi:hypothetical protein
MEERVKLGKLKDSLEGELRELEVETCGKEEKLKVWLEANEALEKYKAIQQQLEEDAER